MPPSILVPVSWLHSPVQHNATVSQYQTPSAIATWNVTWNVKCCIQGDNVSNSNDFIAFCCSDLSCAPPIVTTPNKKYSHLWLGLPMPRPCLVSHICSLKNICIWNRCNDVETLDLCANASANVKFFVTFCVCVRNAKAVYSTELPSPFLDWTSQHFLGSPPTKYISVSV